MKKRYRRAAAVCMTALMIMAMAAGCGSDSTSKASASENDKVFRVGMECNYVPFNWTQGDRGPVRRLEGGADLRI